MFEPHEEQHALNLDALGFDELGRAPLASAGHSAEDVPDSFSAILSLHFFSSPAPVAREFLSNDFRHDD